MKTLRYVALVMLVMFAQLPVASTKTMAQSSPAAGWNVVMVDNVGTNVGHSPSIAINPKTQRPFVSYYDAKNGALRLATQNGSTTGTCSGFGWDCKELNNFGTSGAESALRFNTDNSGAYDIAYTNPANSGLSLYRVAANGTASNHTFLSWNNPEYIKRHNIRFVSLAYRQNQPRVAFAHSLFIGQPDGDIRANTVAYDGLNMSFSDPIGPIDSVNTSDEDVAVDHGDSVSMDFGDDLHPRVAFRAYPHRSLRFASAAGGKSCTDMIHDDEKTNWDCAMIDTTPNTGYYITYKAPHTFGTITTKHQVAYYDATNGLVKYAQYVGGDSTCSAGGAKGWKCVVIDKVGKNNGPMGVSMTLDSKGSPVIAYYDRNDTNHGVLKIARSAGSEIGNCGPVELFATWKCTVVDNGGANGDDVGQMASVAVDAKDKAYVAYFNAPYQALMVAHEKSALAPVLTKAYGKVALNTQATTSVTYTINNASANPALSGIRFSDGLIGGMTFKTTGISNTCGGNVITGNNNTAIKLVGGQLAPNKTCTIVATVVGGNQIGTFDDTTTALASNEAVDTPIASATIRIISSIGPQFSKTYTPPTVTVGTETVVKYVIKNTLPDIALTKVKFSDVYAPELLLDANSLVNSCGGTVSVIDNGLQLINGSIAKGATCSILVKVKPTKAGVYASTTGKLTTNQTITVEGAEATLTSVNPQPTPTKIPAPTATKTPVPTATKTPAPTATKTK